MKIKIKFDDVEITGRDIISGIAQGIALIIAIGGILLMIAAFAPDF